MWSGKEDSNLRPLPPEGASPVQMWRKFVALGIISAEFRAHLPALFTVGGSGRTLNPCLCHLSRALGGAA